MKITVMRNLLLVIFILCSFIFAQTNAVISDNAGKSFYLLGNTPFTMRWSGYVVEEKLFENIYSNALLGKKYDPLEIQHLNDIITAKDNIISLFEYRTNFIEAGYKRMRENDLSIISLKDSQIKAKETAIIVTAIAIPVAFILGILVDHGITVTLK